MTEQHELTPYTVFVTKDLDEPQSREVYELLRQTMSHLSPLEPGEEDSYDLWARTYLSQTNMSHILVSREDVLAGYLGFQAKESGRNLELNNIAVQPSLQGKGTVLRILLREFIRLIDARPEASVIGAGANRRNPRSWRLMERTGFQRIAETERTFSYSTPVHAFLERFAEFRPS